MKRHPGAVGGFVSRGAAVALLALGLGLAASAAAEDSPPETAAEETGGARFGFHGYLRSGFGVDGHGGSLETFQAPNAEAKYRLGNEAETYGELSFETGFRPEDDPAVDFDTRITLAFVTPTSRSSSFSTTTSLREAFAVARGVLKGNPTAAFWAGQRFYDRRDVHINDFFYRDMSGFGGGIEDVQVGGLKLALAWLGGSVDEVDSSGSVFPTNSFQLQKSTFELRAYDLGALGGKAGLTLGLSRFDGDTLDFDEGQLVFGDSVGWTLGLFHDASWGSGGNALRAQYGTGAASDFRALLVRPPGLQLAPGDVVDVDGMWRLRIVDDLKLQTSERLSLLVTGVYQELELAQARTSRLRWVSLGARPKWALGRYFSMVAEAGWDYTWQQDAVTGSLLKLTLAPQINPGATPLSRPALRAFVTYAYWTDGFVGAVAPKAFGEDRHGFAAGVQLETWW